MKDLHPQKFRGNKLTAVTLFAIAWLIFFLTWLFSVIEHGLLRKQNSVVLCMQFDLSLCSTLLDVGHCDAGEGGTLESSF